MSTNITAIKSNEIMARARYMPWRIAAALVLGLGASQLAARDVTQEQGAVQYARQVYEQADAQYQADKAKADTTAKALRALKAQFTAESKAAQLAAGKRRDAKIKLDAAEAALERAWKQ